MQVRVCGINERSCIKKSKGETHTPGICSSAQNTYGVHTCILFSPNIIATGNFEKGKRNGMSGKHEKVNMTGNKGNNTLWIFKCPVVQ